jgi:hypothetical protein
VGVVVIAVVASTEWLRSPSTAIVALVVCAFLTGGGALPAGQLAPPWAGGRAAGPRLRGGGRQVQLTAIGRWQERRESRVQAASERLSGDLHAALHRADRLAQAALAAPRDDRAVALTVLSRLVPTPAPR